MARFDYLRNLALRVIFHVVSPKTLLAVFTVNLPIFHQSIRLIWAYSYILTNKETYSGFPGHTMRESPSLANGVRFRSLSFRSSWVQIPSPAPVFHTGRQARRGYTQFRVNPPQESGLTTLPCLSRHESFSTQRRRSSPGKPARSARIRPVFFFVFRHDGNPGVKPPHQGVGT